MNQADYLLSPKAIRERTLALYHLAEKGGTHFRLQPEKLPQIASLVIEVTRSNYPDLAIPFHSRWGHFRAGKKDRLQSIHQNLANIKKRDPLEYVRTLWDLVIPSVLLDAGAGDRWKFTESDGTTISRSEGLGVASLALFQAGSLSTNSKNLLQSDANGLSQFSTEALESAFQVTPNNPLLGCEGRAKLLRKLGEVVYQNPEYFPEPSGKRGQVRVGSLIDYLFQKFGKNIRAPDLLLTVLKALGPIWPGRVRFEGQALGDVWSHPELGPKGSFESLVPFHKLSQWLTYSLIEPLLDAGFSVPGVEELTGLAEYRNGGLVLDGGLISLRNPDWATQPHSADSPLVVEWRALTLVFLDRLAEEVRRQLQKTPQELPLAKVLEGGTWWAGRKLAKEIRPNTSNPPLELVSDGTVF